MPEQSLGACLTQQDAQEADCAMSPRGTNGATWHWDGGMQGVDPKAPSPGMAWGFVSVTLPA